MDYNEFFKKLKKDELFPIYLFKGEETYIMEKAIDTIFQRISPAKKRIFYGDESDAEEILRNSLGMDLFDNKNILTVVKKSEALGKKISKLMEGGNWNPRNPLILISVSPTKDLLSKISSSIPQITFSFPSSQNFTKWLRKELKNRNIRTDTEVFQLLKNKFPKSLTFISKELDKLALFAGGEPIDALTIEEVLTEEEEITQWKIIDLVVKGERKKLFTELEKYIKLGRPIDDIFYIMSQIIYYMFLAKVNRDLFKRIVKEDWKRNKYQKFSERYTEEELIGTLSLLQKLFLRLRSVQLNKSVVIKNLFLSIS